MFSNIFHNVFNRHLHINIVTIHIMNNCNMKNKFHQSATGYQTECSGLLKSRVQCLCYAGGQMIIMVLSGLLTYEFMKKVIYYLQKLTFTRKEI